MITREEYLYRPPLVKFAPSPETMKYDISDPGRPFYDKFERLFMRTIYVLSISGLNTKQLNSFFTEQLKIIHSSATGNERNEKYRNFSIFRRSCTTIIRDELRHGG